MSRAPRSVPLHVVDSNSTLARSGRTTPHQYPSVLPAPGNNNDSFIRDGRSANATNILVRGGGELHHPSNVPVVVSNHAFDTTPIGPIEAAFLAGRTDPAIIVSREAARQYDADSVALRAGRQNLVPRRRANAFSEAHRPDASLNDQGVSTVYNSAGPSSTRRGDVSDHFSGRLDLPASYHDSPATGIYHQHNLPQSMGTQPGSMFGSVAEPEPSLAAELSSGRQLITTSGSSSGGPAIADGSTPRRTRARRRPFDESHPRPVRDNQNWEDWENECLWEARKRAIYHWKVAADIGRSGQSCRLQAQKQRAMMKKIREYGLVLEGHCTWYALRDTFRGLKQLPKSPTDENGQSPSDESVSQLPQPDSSLRTRSHPTTSLPVTNEMYPYDMAAMSSAQEQGWVGSGYTTTPERADTSSRTISRSRDDLPVVHQPFRYTGARNDSGAQAAAGFLSSPPWQEDLRLFNQRKRAHSGSESESAARRQRLDGPNDRQLMHRHVSSINLSPTIHPTPTVEVRRQTESRLPSFSELMNHISTDARLFAYSPERRVPGSFEQTTTALPQRPTSSLSERTMRASTPRHASNVSTQTMTAPSAHPLLRYHGTMPQ
ncbi:hypothetical protein MBLNU459_g7178t2 [Dothideomycetes sp. NU459]